MSVRDLELVLAVSLQAGALAYLREPRWKAAVFSLPIPFTMASLSVGRPIGATNVLALVLLLLYTQCVRVLHQERGVPIVPAIVLSAGAYIGLGTWLAALVPDTDLAFWASFVFVMLLGGVLLRILPRRDEPAYRSPLPVWVKLPLIAGIVFLLVALKHLLQGFMTLFPMMGTVGAYEARHSLWTIGRQMPVVMITLAPMMAVCRISQAHVGLAASLLCGWGAFLLLFIPLMWADWRRAPVAQQNS